MSRRMWALAVAAWVGVVIAGSALTWIAINRAGDQVTGAQAAATTEPTLLSSAATTQTTAPPPTGAPGKAATRTPSPTPRTAHTPTPRAARTPTGTPAPAPEPPAPAPPRTETRTWTGAAGFVSVACTGRLAQLRGASPGDGWTYEVGDRSGDSVEVRFAKGETEVNVHAQCVSGTPEFQVESGRD